MKLDKYYLRQKAVYGVETQAKIRQLKVIICHLTKLGLEIAKNLVLIGPKTLAFHDNQIITKETCKSIYFENKQGQTKAQNAADHFKSLNHRVEIKVQQKLDLAKITQTYDIIVMTDIFDHDFIIKVDNIMHQMGKGVIIACQLGPFTYMFVDFGSHHIIEDKTGELDFQECIKKITREKRGIVHFRESNSISIQTGQQIMIYDVHGMEEINGKTFIVQKIDKQTYFIGDTRDYSPYIFGGIAIRPKVRNIVNFITFQQNFNNQKYNLQKQQIGLLKGIQKLDPHNYIIIKIIENFNHLINDKSINNQKLVERLIFEGQLIINKQNIHQHVNKQLLQTNIRRICEFRFKEFIPLSTLWGGIVAQEVIKYTGKYCSTNQWLIYNQKHLTSQSQTQQRINQYDKSNQPKNIMICGAGSIGCEIIKTLAQMDHNKINKITLVSHEQFIEDNLNRICLLNQADLNKNLAQLLSKKVQKYNNRLNIQSLSLQIDNIDQQTWLHQDIIISAVNSYKCRTKIDNYCITYQKICLDCGTQGLKAHMHVTIPFLTQSFQDFNDPAQFTTDLSTTKNFPFRGKHAVQYILSVVNDLLQKTKIINDLSSQNQQIKNKAKSIILQPGNYEYMQILKVASSNSYVGCVKFAFFLFYTFFEYSIQQLLEAFPHDKLNYSNEYFWTGLKRCPTPIQIDLKNEVHQQFIIAVSTMYAQMLHIPLENQTHTLEIIESLKAQYYTEVINTVRVYKKQQQDSEDYQYKSKQFQIIYSQLSSKSVFQFSQNNQSENYMKIIISASIIRMKNYQILQLTPEQIYIIANKVVPTLVTGSAVAAGLLCIELVKILNGNSVNHLRNSYVNMAQSIIVQSCLSPSTQMKDEDYNIIFAAPTKVIPQAHSKWEKIHLYGPLTVRQIKELFEDRFKMTVEVISINGNLLYASFHFHNYHLQQQIFDVHQQKQKERPKKAYKRPSFLDIQVSGSQFEFEVFLPMIRYFMLD